MQAVEITAKSLQEATKSAAEKLGVTPDEITVSVLEETKGLFGKSSVRVRAELIQKEAPAENAPEENAPEAEVTPKEKTSKKAGAKEVIEEVPAPVIAEKAPPKKLGRKVKTEPVAVEAPVEKPSAPATEETVAADEPIDESSVSEEVKPEDASEEDAAPGVIATQDDADAILAILQDMLAASGLNVSVKISGLQNRYVNIQLDGKDAAFLVGKHGEVLNALQYLVNIVSGRKMQNGVRATIDANDYRRRREDALTNLANKIADQVVQRGEEAVLDALPAFERRIVHKALSVRTGIVTYSEGEEPNRRVVIAPGD